jgi:hypothetical protein
VGFAGVRCRMESYRENGAILTLCTKCSQTVIILLGTDLSTQLASESAFLRGEPGCYNGIDLEGSYVEEATLTFRMIETNRCKSVSPREVIWGILGNAPATTPVQL